ncbi:MAG: transporter substrate-binding domain-containing protein [Gammaproteobacteria bacterium]|nr:MAG: transporter substrate-binding domain-containing protein [Gammaproteobacteria bacterium]
MITSLTRTALGAVILASFTLAATQANAANDRFKKVLDRGKLVVGVKADYKPWGFRDSSGKLVGMEIDMAQDVADALGVTLELVPVQSSNRMQFLQQGKIDLMIATMSDKANRRKVVGIPQPNYYTSGTNVLAKKGMVSSWADLKGKPVCGKQGAFYNKQVSKKYGAKIIAFVGNAEAKQALRDGKCVAWVYDDSSIMADLASGQYDDYEMPMMTEDDNPWALAVPLDELDGIWGNFMSGMIYNWHSSGRLIELEKKWGIQTTQFVVDMNKRFEPYEAN